MEIWTQWVIIFGLSVFVSCDETRDLHNARRFLAATNSTPSLFHHRAYHNSIAVRDYLYVDGGELVTWNGRGSGYEDLTKIGNFTNLPNNYTYSIDLTSSWTNQSVVLKQISKGSAPVLNTEALWLDDSGTTFYAYDGGVSFSLPPADLPGAPENALWRFSPSGDSGRWSLVSVSPASNFSTLSRTTEGIYGYGGGLGFAIGGQEDEGTNQVYGVNGATVNAPNMVVYNTSSQEWYNVSTRAISYYGTAQYGMAQFVPSFGPVGLLFVLGGQAVSGDTNSDPYFSFQNLSFYEPVSQTWKFQTASGQFPQEVVTPCVTGVDGDNGTYEIFLYGGVTAGSIESSIQMGVVYVLSLPSFHWEKQNYSPVFGRSRHTCSLAGSRQMIVVGGQIATADSRLAVDPWPQGIGVFDLSAMQWSDSYDPNAASYVTPQAVKTYIKNNGRYPSVWSDQTVEAYFTKHDSANAPSSKNTTKSHSSKSTSDTGAIAGGVVGGVVGVAVIAALMFLVLRRRRKASASQRSTSAEYRDELEAKPQTYEMANADKPLEMDGGVRAEMEGGWQGHEFGGATSPR